MVRKTIKGSQERQRFFWKVYYHLKETKINK